MDEAPEDGARQRLGPWLHLGGEMETASKAKPIRVVELISNFTAWLDRNRSQRTAGEGRKHLRRFLRLPGDCWCHSLRINDQEAFLDGIEGPLSKRHHGVTIEMMARLGRIQDLIPRDFDPDAGLSLPASPRKPWSSRPCPGTRK